MYEVQRLDSLTVNVYFSGQCTTDSDGDGSVDGRDAFPSDVAASVDTATGRQTIGTRALARVTPQPD